MNVTHRIASIVGYYPVGDVPGRILEEFVVTPRSDLPPVTVHDHGRITADGLGGEVSGVETASRNALAWLALAEYLDAHPPVDEAQVRALTELIDDTHQSWDSKRIATYLARHGVTVKEQK